MFGINYLFYRQQSYNIYILVDGCVENQTLQPNNIIL